MIAPDCEVTQTHPDAIARTLEALPGAATLERAVLILKAVSDGTRLRLLVALGTQELCVCDLAAITATSESAVSHQLRLLRERDLVKFTKRGREVYYRLADHHVLELIQSALEHAQEQD